MDRCPSCNAEREDERTVCENCGHIFDDEDAGKRTMMGFPGLEALIANEPAEEVEPNKQTLFGFPALKEDEEEESEVEEDETSIMADPRGTIAGFNLQNHPFSGEASESLDEDSAGTMGGPSFGPIEEDAATQETQTDMEPPPNRGFGTMMGVGVAEIMAGEVEQTDEFPRGIGADEPASPRSTQFAMPAFSEPEEDSDASEVDDASTVSWNPSMAADVATDSPEKKEVLEKLRQDKPSPLRETGAQAIPALGPKKSLPKPGGLSKLGLSVPKPKSLLPEREQVATPHEFPEDKTEIDSAGKAARASEDTATTGVLRRAGERRAPATESTAVAGAYVVPKDNLTADDLNEEEDDAPTEMIQAPSFLEQASTSLNAATDVEDDEDLAYAETGVVPGNIADRALAMANAQLESELPEIPVASIETPKKLDPWAQSGEMSIQDQIGQTAENVFTPMPSDAPDAITNPPSPTAPTAFPDSPFSTGQQQPTPFPTPEPYAPLTPQPSNNPQQANRVHQPTAIATPSAPDDEKLIRTIQMIFGLLSAVIILLSSIANGVIGPGNKFGYLPIAVCFLTALLVAGASFAKSASMSTKSIVFGVGGGVTLVMGIFGLATAVPIWQAFVFAAFVAVISAVFPIAARKIL